MERLLPVPMSVPEPALVEPIAVPDVLPEDMLPAVLPEFIGAVLVEPLMVLPLDMPEPVAVVPEPPGVPVVPIGVPCVLCWPAPV
ncbi:MAG: hypothetical protein LH617_07565, partial [Ramlibacter sp.]|nr:hypothetical protein [Ramlibacter sp.]